MQIVTPQGERGHESLGSQYELLVPNDAAWNYLQTKCFLQNWIILIIDQIIKDSVWSTPPILKVEILRKVCLKFGKAI